MEKTDRRKFIAKASLVSFGTTMSGMQSFLNPDLSVKANIPVVTNSVKMTPAKSKRDLMMQVLDMSARPAYIPAGFFMHFGVKGDAAIKVHLEYFRETMTILS